jgi:HlyD family secretion protein
MNRRAVALLVAALAGAALLARGTLFRGTREGDVLAASGTVEATEAQLGFQTPGRIAEVRVREGDAVRAGDTLAVLDRGELLARHAQALAQLAAARAQLAELEAGARPEERAVAREALRAATQQFEDARRDLERVRRLHEAGALAREALDKAQLAYDVTESRRSQAEEQQRLVLTGPRAERIAAQRALLAQAEATVRQADAALGNAVIVAPFAGVVSIRHREPGETAPAGGPVLTLTNLDDRWVRIYIPEDAVGAVALGQHADITADTYPGRRYGGAVAFIASQAEFTPRNVQTQEERVKLVYAVKVRITDDPALELKPGVPADVVLRRAAPAGGP